MCLIKDISIQWHNNIQKWNCLNSEGLLIIAEIDNHRLIAGRDNENQQDDVAVELPLEEFNKLQESCSKMISVGESMKAICNKMKNLRNSLHALQKLDGEQNRSDSCSAAVPNTVDLDYFCKAAEKLLKMYEKEMDLKEIIIQNIVTAPDKNIFVFYTSSWLHQVYITEDSTFMIQCMLAQASQACHCRK